MLPRLANGRLADNVSVVLAITCAACAVTALAFLWRLFVGVSDVTTPLLIALATGIAAGTVSLIGSPAGVAGGAGATTAGLALALVISRGRPERYLPSRFRHRHETPPERAAAEDAEARALGSTFLLISVPLAAATIVVTAFLLSR